MSKTQIDGKPVTPIPANIPEELAPIYEWLRENGKSFLYQAAIIVLVVAVGLAFTRSRAAKLERASATLSTANDVASLEDANARYGGTRLGPVIRLRLAHAYFSAGQFDSAKDAYAAFVKRSSKHPLATSAKLGLAASHEALQEFQQAIAAYRDVGAPAGSPAAFLAKMGQARALAASGDKAAASALAASIAEEATGTQWEDAANGLSGIIDRFDGFRTVSFSDQLSALRSTLAPTDAADISADAAADPIDDAADANAGDAPADDASTSAAE